MVMVKPQTKHLQQSNAGYDEDDLELMRLNGSEDPP